MCYILNHTFGVGGEARGRGSGGGGLSVAGSASLSIGLGLDGDSRHCSGEPCNLCSSLHPLFYTLRDRGLAAKLLG